MKKDKSLLYRDLLSSLASSIAVVTVGYNNEYSGLTVNSFTSVSLSPFLVLFCVNSTSKTFSLIKSRKAFNINFLTDKQQEISQLFSSKIDNKFDNLKFEYGQYFNCPVIPSILGYLECSLYRYYNAGDHMIVIGEVQNFCDNHRKPLVYCNRKYYSLEQLQNLDT